MDKLERDMILIQRRSREVEDHGAHGIWKIAYADFMTALMAFFLIMWLLNATTDDQKTSVANYFNPIKLADISPTRKGVEAPREVIQEQDESGEAAISPTQEHNASSGASNTLSGDSAYAAKPRFPESALFLDPYAILAKLADDEAPEGRNSAQEGVSAEASTFATEELHTSTPSTAIKDPFDPSYWRLAPGGQPSASAVSNRNNESVGKQSDAEKPVPLKSNGTSETDLQSKNNNQASKAEKQGTTISDIEALKADVANALKEESRSSDAPEVSVKQTPDGILISLTDADHFSMFARGSAEPTAASIRAISRIAAALSKRPGSVIVRGHTDSAPFKSDTYDNWRLSSARAHMASYMLIRGGLAAERIERIEGYADRMPVNTNNTRAPENRRIEILLREK